MVELKEKHRTCVLPLFDTIPKWKAACFSAIESGYGELYADDASAPNASVLFYGGLVVYAGDYGGAAAGEIAEVFKEQPLILGYSEGWNKLLMRKFADRVSMDVRFHMPFSGLHARTLAEAPTGDGIAAIGQCEAGDFDLLEVSLTWEHQKYHYRDRSDFIESAFPFLAKLDGKVVSGASAFIRSRKHAECQVNTAPEMRRKGLARLTGASFLKKCLETDVEIPWDAANEASVRLGQHFGYTCVERYEVLSIMEKE